MQHSPWPDTLAEALQDLTVIELQQIASIIGGRLPTRKAELIAAIAARMEGPALQTTWDMLTPFQRYAIAEAVHGGPEAVFNWTRIYAKYSDQPGANRLPELSWSRAHRPEPSDCAFFMFSPNGHRIPRDLARRLRSVVPEPMPETIAYSEAPVENADEGLRIFTGAIAAPVEFEMMLHLIRSVPVSVSPKTGRPAAAAQRRIGPLLFGGDFYPPDQPSPVGEEPVGPIRAYAWPVLMQMGGLAKPVGSNLIMTEKGRDALHTPAAEGLKRLFHEWLQNRDFDEFRRIDAVKGQTAKGGHHMTSPAARRSAIVRALRNLEPSRWVDFDDWTGYMLAAGFEFDVTEDPWQLYVVDRDYGNLGNYSDAVSLWSVLEERYMLVVLFEYLATLGLIDIAYTFPEEGPKNYQWLWGADQMPCLSRYDGLLAFRLNDLGAYILGMTDTYTPAAPQPKSRLKYAGHGVVLDPSGTLLPADRVLLERIAAARPNGSSWEITSASLSAAVQAGFPAADVRPFLENLLGGLPDELDFLISDVEAGGERFSLVGRGVVLRLRDAALAERLAADASLRRSVLQAGGDYIVVLPGNEKAVQRRLRRMGFVLPDEWFR